MMLGLFGLMAIDETRPLARSAFSAVGLGPIGTQTVPWRLIASARREARLPRLALLRDPGHGSLAHPSRSQARVLRPRAVFATAQAHERTPPASEERLLQAVVSQGPG